MKVAEKLELKVRNFNRLLEIDAPKPEWICLVDTAHLLETDRKLITLL